MWSPNRAPSLYVRGMGVGRVVVSVTCLPRIRKAGANYEIASPCNLYSTVQYGRCESQPGEGRDPFPTHAHTGTHALPFSKGKREAEGRSKR
jgi:hypothetical protein